MREKVTAAAASALILMASAFPAWGDTNFALVKDNDVSAVAVSGQNDQEQNVESLTKAKAYKGKAVAKGGDQTQIMVTGNSYAGAEQTIVANVDACCDPCDKCDKKCDKCDCGCKDENKAIIKKNDVSAEAVSGQNVQLQNVASLTKAKASKGKAVAKGGDQTQIMETGDAEAWAAQWIVVNSKGSF